MSAAVGVEWAGFRHDVVADLRLLCFPAAGGGASTFHPWGEALAADVDVLAARLPGREARIRDTPFLAMEELVRAATDSMEQIVEAPFALYGHSLGGWVVFEVARELRARGWPGPVHLFVAGCGAPHLADPAEPIHGLPADEFLAAVKDLDGIPREAFEHPQLLELALPALRADFTVYETYRYRPGEPLGCPISALGGREDSRVSEAQLRAWEEQTRGGFSLRMLDGGHFFPVRSRRAVIDAVREDLDAWLAGRR